jgi:predicted DNA-binding protein
MQNKDKRVTIRLPYEEYEHYKSLAEDDEKTLSMWMRSTLNENSNNIPYSAKLLRLIAENADIAEKIFSGKDNASYRHKLIDNLEDITMTLKKVIDNG